MFSFTRILGFCTAAIVLVVFAYAFSSSALAPPQGGKAEGSIRGYVATVLLPQLEARPFVPNKLVGPESLSFGAPIFLPDINVVAKNERGFTSKTAVTNPQGYFVITDLPEGTYQICVSGTGYKSQCD